MSETRDWLNIEIPSAIMSLVQDILPEGPDAFQSLFVDYHPPTVHRLWVQWGSKRLLLHRIDPCEAGKALYHPHPWPSVVKVLRGRYEMGVGHKPPSTILHLAEGSEYAMMDPKGWHYVQPFNGPCYTILIAGKLYQTEELQIPEHAPNNKLKPLGDLAKLKLWWEFCQLLKVPVPDDMVQDFLKKAK